MSIEISRKDILSEYICDYPVEDKFLKLPVEPYMDLLGIEPLPSQSFRCPSSANKAQIVCIRLFLFPKTI